MKTLIGYELKKMFSRRMLWAAMALGLVMILYLNGIILIEDRLGGRVQGMKDVYARFDGQVLTDAVAAQAMAELEAYIARHPDDFTTYGSNTYFPLRYHDYAGGLWEGCTRIAQGYTVEQQQNMRSGIEKMVQTGLDEEGKPLSEQTMNSYMSYLAEDHVPPMITYYEGYTYLYNVGQCTGTMTLFWVLLLTAWLFPAERSARMESLVLTARKRREAVLAKMTAAALGGMMAFFLFFGIYLLIIALTYGLYGFSTPPHVMNALWTEGTAGQALIGYLAMSLAAAVAMAVFIALLSAVIRRPIGALLGGAVAVAVQIIPDRIAAGSLDIPVLRDFFYYEAAGKALRNIFLLLPATALGLWDCGRLFILGAHTGYVLLGLGISAFVTALSILLAPRLWLRQRRV